MTPYTLNLTILLVILYRIFIGMECGLFNEFINLVNFLFSAGMSFIIFRSLGPYVEKYIFPNERYALVIAFWASFILFISILWSIKQLSFAKIYSMTKEKTIHFLTPIDKIGGAICGIILGLNLMSCIIVSLYIAPATKNLYSLHEEDKIIFKTDKHWLKIYSILELKEQPVEADKKQEEIPKVEEVNQE